MINFKKQTMRKRIIVLIFIIPFLVVDLIVLPFSLLYWLMTGIMLEPLCQQLIETTKNEK